MSSVSRSQRLLAPTRRPPSYPRGRAPSRSSRTFCGRSSTIRTITLSARRLDSGPPGKCADVDRLLEVAVKPAASKPRAVLRPSRTRSRPPPGSPPSHGSARSRASASTPSMPGRLTSIRIRSGTRSAAERHARLAIARLEHRVARVRQHVAHELQVARRCPRRSGRARRLTAPQPVIREAERAPGARAALSTQIRPPCSSTNRLRQSQPQAGPSASRPPSPRWNASKIRPGPRRRSRRRCRDGHDRLVALAARRTSTARPRA